MGFFEVNFLFFNILKFRVVLLSVWLNDLSNNQWLTKIFKSKKIMYLS